jgi:hypothetical protein
MVNLDPLGLYPFAPASRPGWTVRLNRDPEVQPNPEGINGIRPGYRIDLEYIPPLNYPTLGQFWMVNKIVATGQRADGVTESEWGYKVDIVDFVPGIVESGSDENSWPNRRNIRWAWLKIHIEKKAGFAEAGKELPADVDPEQVSVEKPVKLAEYMLNHMRGPTVTTVSDYYWIDSRVYRGLPLAGGFARLLAKGCQTYEELKVTNPNLFFTSLDVLRLF